MQEIEIGEEVIALEVSWLEDISYVGAIGTLECKETIHSWSLITVKGKTSSLVVKKYARVTDLLKELV